MTELHDSAWFAGKVGKTTDWVRHNLARIPHRKIGRSVAFTDDDLTAYLEQVAVRPRRMETTGRKRNRRTA